jgi:S-adenosylmethionine:tRNA ribosyltransferase-isomerase
MKKVRDGETIVFTDALSAVVEGRGEGRLHLRFSLSGEEFDAALNAAGAMPLPPYIAARRDPDDADREDYQPVFARRAGAVAAPTASLHFDEALLERIAARGVRFAHVTLHVGAGTFLPVKVDDIAEHRMHAEWGEVTPEAAAAINAARAEGGRIVAVGTTALRLIESAATEGGVAPWRGETDLFIAPGFRFRVADGLMTNFHLPKSTLMMLVAALMGRERILALYAHAIARRYRFFSYGDATLLFPQRNENAL